MAIFRALKPNKKKILLSFIILILFSAIPCVKCQYITTGRQPTPVLGAFLALFMDDIQTYTNMTMRLCLAYSGIFFAAAFLIYTLACALYEIWHKIKSYK